MNAKRQQEEAKMAAARAELRRQPRVVTDEKVLAWRRRELVRLGFTPGQAQTLAVRGDVDLHELAGWLTNGCTIDTAIRIVAPLIETSTALAVTDLDLAVEAALAEHPVPDAL